MVHGGRVLPELTGLTAAHWTSGASGRLSVQRCLRCRRWSFPPTSACRHCWGAGLEFEPVAGKGVLVTWTTVTEPVRPTSVVPYRVAVVDLAEGVRLLLGLVGGASDDLRVGAPVRLVFDRADDRVWLPLAEIEESDLSEDRIRAVS